MFDKKLLVVLLIGLAAGFAGCKSSFFGSKDAPAAPPPPPAPVSVAGIRTSYADIVEKTSPAVVRIDAEIKTKAQAQFPFGDGLFGGSPLQPGQPPRQQLERGIGSGVIVSADGTILTNNHVVDGASKITVQLNNDKTFDAKVVGADKPSDLAVLKIDAQNMPFLTLGDSDSVRVGDIVLAIGNPLGIGQTVTAGIISAKGRRTGLSDGSSFEDFLQTDAPINRGNSGGALVNLNGELIGINSQILSPGGASGGNIGIGFSIPSNMARNVMEQLLKDGKVHRGMLGIYIQNITDDTAKADGLQDTQGVLVSDVVPGGAAENAGIKRYDIITAVNGEKIEDSNVFRNKVASTAPGTEIKLTIVRDGKEQEVTAKLDEFSDKAAQNGPDGQDDNQSGPEKESGKLGLSLQPITPQVARQLKLNSDSGLVITDIDPVGPAAEAGLARGDVIMEINKQPVASVDDVKAALDKAGSNPILLLIGRQGRTFVLTVRAS
ncbi:MAG TPA: DegQ family serine endoprotease [Pyrinomonadaceae bacterium]|jgi:Do/DeqQ family serine protease